MPWTPLRTAAALLLTACQVVPVDDDPTVVEDDSTGATAGDPTTTTNSSDDDPSPEFGCAPADANSCPMGQKCTAVSEGGFQNKLRCVNDDGMIPLGEDCTPAPGTGQDGCATGTVCIISSDEDIVGTCVRLCTNDSDCEPGKCAEHPTTLTPFCADSCDPLFPDCQPGRACLQADDRFVCGIPTPEDDNVTGEDCDAINLRGCAEGFACMTGALVPGCASSGCCTPVCDQNGGDEQCTVPSLCKVLFPEPAPGFEDLGACYVPT